MLARGTSDAAARLRRAKSAPSVPKPVKRTSSVDETSTYQNARTAAARAYDSVRHTESSNQDKGGHGSVRRVKQTKKNSNFHALHRKSSRYLGEAVRSKSRPVVRDLRTNLTSTSESARPSLEQHSSVNTVDTNGSTLNRYVETPQNSIGCTPSQESHNSSGGNELNYFGSRENIPTPTQLGPPQRGRLFYQGEQPVLLLGGECHVPIPTARENQTDDAIIALARDRYLKDYRNAEIRPKKSFLSDIFRQPLVRLKQELGRPSGETLDEEIHLHGDSHHKRRIASSQTIHKVSESVRRGFRRTFRRSSQIASTMPIQHIHATEPHYRTPSYTSALPHRMSDTAASVAPKSTSRPDSIISIEAKTDEDHSFWPNSSTEPHSLQSFRISSSDGSRVTSWADSSRQNTLLIHEFDQLPIIRERTEPRTSSIRSRNTDGDIFACVLPEIPLRQSSSKFEINGITNSRRTSRGIVERPEDIESRACLAKASQTSGLSSLKLADDDPSFSPQTAEQDYRTYGLSATIRNVQDDLSFHSQDTPSSDDCEKRNSTAGRENVASPSIYSVRREVDPWTLQDSTMSYSPRPIQYGGTALVGKTQPVSSWSLTSLALKGQKQPLKTSNEWRAWMKDELEELGTTGTIPLDEDYSPWQIGLQQSMGHRRESAQMNTLEQHAPTRSSEPLRPRRVLSDHIRLSRRPSQAMNDRFPMIHTDSQTSAGRVLPFGKISNSQSHILKQQGHVQSTNSASENPSVRECRIDTEHLQNTNRRSSKNSRGILCEMSSTQNSSLGNSVQDEVLGSSKQPTVSLQETGNRISPDRSVVTQRGLLDENFLLRIRKGPYAEQSSSPTREGGNSPVPPKRSFGSNRHQENTPPSKGQQMAEIFLRSRSSGKLSSSDRSSQAFL